MFLFPAIYKNIQKHKPIGHFGKWMGGGKFLLFEGTKETKKWIPDVWNGRPILYASASSLPWGLHQLRRKSSRKRKSQRKRTVTILHMFRLLDIQCTCYIIYIYIHHIYMYVLHINYSIYVYTHILCFIIKIIVTDNHLERKFFSIFFSYLERSKISSLRT